MAQLTRQWTFRLANERNVGARRPIIAGDTVYVALMYDKRGFFESRLLALDLATGAERWSYTIGHVGNEPLVADDAIYWSSFEGGVHALDHQGRLRWKAPGTSSNIGVPVLAGADRLCVSEIAGGAKYTWCLDRTTGAMLWRFAHGGHAYRLFHSEGRVYHTSVAPTDPDPPTRCSLHCLAARDGRVEWSASEGEYLFSPVVIEGQVYVCSHTKLYIHDAVSGRRLGDADLGAESGTIAPFSTKERLLAWGSSAGRGSDSLAAYTVAPVKRLFRSERLVATRQWMIDEPSGLCDAPIELGPDRLAYLTQDGVVHIVAAETGERVSAVEMKTKSSQFGGLALAGDRLVVAHGREVAVFSTSG